MGVFACLCNAFKKRLERLDEPNVKRCNCGWEIETGYAVAVGLAILEAKRLFLLVVGIFVDWNVVYFAGGFVPLVLTVVAASVGVPAAVAVVFTVHKRREEPCFPLLRRLLRCLAAAILLCAILNAVTIGSIGFYLNIRPEALAKVFNTSMMLYSEEIRYKVTIDELQFTFQCCGHTKYNDWLVFDWQRVDYASREEMSEHARLSDEEFRSMAVPYSCCNVRTIGPCFHMDLSMNTASTINEAGCAETLSHIVLRGALVAYCVSAFLVLTQILLALLITKIARRPLPPACPSLCNCTEKSPSVCPLLETSTSCASSTSYTSGSDRISSRAKKRCGRLSTISSRTSSSPSPPPSTNTKKNSSRNPSARTRCSGGCGNAGAARIRPSLHTEHRVPKKSRCYQKRVRPN